MAGTPRNPASHKVNFYKLGFMDSTIKRWAARAKQTVLGDAFVRRMPLLYARACRVFEMLSQAPLEQRIAWSQARLQKVLRAALRTPYGKKIGSPNLEDWPLLEKDQVRDCPEAFLAAPKWATIPASTSGTTGTPLRVYRSLPSIVAEQAAIDYVLRSQGLNFSKARIAVLRGDNIKDPADKQPPFWRDELKGRKRVFSSNHLSKTTFPYFLQSLREFQPDCLYAYPSILESLCQLLLQNGEAFQVAYVVTSSEQPSPALRELVEQALQAHWIDYYGLAERNAFAYSRFPDGYYFLPGYGWTEFHPIETTSEGTRYEIVATGLWNLAMPLVRYRTGDVVSLPADASETERAAVLWGLQPFGGIQGRFGDYLVAPDGAVLMGIDHIPRDVRNVARMQVIQDSPTQVRIRVLPLPGYSSDDEEQILANARLKLPPTMQARVEIAEQLERTAQGKTPFVIRKV